MQDPSEKKYVCSICPNWDPIPGQLLTRGRTGKCRGDLPRMVPVANALEPFPYVREEDWCRPGRQLMIALEAAKNYVAPPEQPKQYSTLG